MPKPLLYRPPPKWHWWAAMGGAVLIHAVAVIAAMKREAPPVDLSNIPDAVVIGLELPQQQPVFFQSTQSVSQVGAPISLPAKSSPGRMTSIAMKARARTPAPKASPSFGRCSRPRAR